MDSKNRTFSLIRTRNFLATDAVDGEVQKMKFINSTPNKLRSNINLGYVGEIVIIFSASEGDPINISWSNCINLYDTIDFSKNDTQRVMEKNIY